MNKKKVSAGFIVLLLLVAAAVFLLRQQKQVLAAAVPPSSWSVVVQDRALREEEIRLTRPAMADVVAVEQAVLSSKLTGYITRLPLLEGERFKRGEVLAVIGMNQSGGNAAQGSSLKADLAAAESFLLAEQERLQRSRKLYQIGGVSLEELQVAEAGFAAAQTRATVARENLRNSVLVATFDGVVAARLVQAGDLATPGKPLLRVVALGPQRVLVDVPESMALTAIELAGQMYPVRAWPEATGQGLRRWETRVDGLMPGGKLEVKLVTFSGKGLFIPGECMLNNDGRRADLVRLPANDAGPASVQQVDLLVGGMEGAVANPVALAGARVACASPDVLNRLAGGTPYRLSGAR